MGWLDIETPQKLPPRPRVGYDRRHLEHEFVVDVFAPLEKRVLDLPVGRWSLQLKVRVEVGEEVLEQENGYKALIDMSYRKNGNLDVLGE